MPFRDDDHAELYEDEFPDPDDEDLDNTDTCPHCDSAIITDAERCPFCGNYLLQEDRPSRPSWLIVSGAVICLAIVLIWIFRG
jgi:hypothetical protein